MACPVGKISIIKQFNDDPDAVWTAYKANNPNHSDAHLEIYFDELYSHCYAKNAPEHSPETSFNLPQSIRDAITKCITTTKVPVP
ncbi:hypothetical protein GGR71_003419 [Xanthomonas sp. F1]